IGWQHVDTPSIFTTAFDPVSILANNTVKIASGVGAGSVYKFIGASPLFRPMGAVQWLTGLNYLDKSQWEQIDLASSPAEVVAYVTNSSIDAARDLKITALEDATITSRVKADSQALSVGFGAVGAAVAGADSENKIKTLVKAYIDGDRDSGTTGIQANNIALKADDHSTITATTQSASVAKAYAVVGASVSIGVGLARNEISNEVETYIANANGLSASSLDYGVSTAPDFTSASTAVSLKRGDRVLLASDYGTAEFDTSSVGMTADETPLVAGDKTFNLVH